MPIGRAPRLTEAEVTDEAIYLNRRAFLAAAAAATLALGGSPGSAGAGAVPSALGPLQPLLSACCSCGTSRGSGTRWTRGGPSSNSELGST